MIEILPMKNLEMEEKILRNLLEKDDKGRVLEMTERGSVLGTVATAIREKTLVIFDFLLESDCDFDNLDPEQSFFVDTLMRSAASYGETNGVNRIETANNKYNKFLKQKGFTVDENHAFTAIGTIVHYT